jgi:predicted RNase H-like HicB family nuclease
MKYAVIFEKAEHNWAAHVPDLPGCVTTGTTLGDARRLIAERSRSISMA